MWNSKGISNAKLLIFCEKSKFYVQKFVGHPFFHIFAKGKITLEFININNI
jgi:hypothetical protein